MSFWSQANPVGAFADFRAFHRSAGPGRWRFMVLAVITSATIMTPMLREEHRIEPRPPTIIYINSWRADRSDAEILSSNRVNQRQKEAMAVEQAKREQLVKDMYKAVGRASGFDVDAMERAARADAAADAAASAAKLKSAATAEP